MFVSKNMLWARLVLILARDDSCGLKWALRSTPGKNIYAQERKLNVITLEGIDEVKTEKNGKKIVGYFSPTLQENGANIAMASRF